MDRRCSSVGRGCRGRCARVRPVRRRRPVARLRLAARPGHPRRRGRRGQGRGARDRVRATTSRRGRRGRGRRQGLGMAELTRDNGRRLKMASTSPHSVAGPHTARVSAPTTAGQPGNLVGQRDDGRQDDRGGSPIRCGAGPPANERGAIHGVRCRWRSASRAASSAWRTSTTGSPTAASTSRAIRPHAGGRRLDGFDTGHGVSAHSGRRGMASELRAAGSVYDGRADGRRLARPADGRPLRLSRQRRGWSHCQLLRVAPPGSGAAGSGAGRVSAYGAEGPGG